MMPLLCKTHLHDLLIRYFYNLSVDFESMQAFTITVHYVIFYGREVVRDYQCEV